MGLDVSELAEDDDPVLVVCSVSVDYHYPARLRELVHATCAVIASGGASIRVRQSVVRDDKMLVSGEV